MNEGKFVGGIDKDGAIYEAATGRKGTLIGYDREYVDNLREQLREALERVDEYYKWLVELGAIIPPKTPEEVAREAAEAQVKLLQEQLIEQGKVNAALTEALGAITARLDAVEGSGADAADVSGVKQRATRGADGKFTKGGASR